MKENAFIRLRPVRSGRRRKMAGATSTQWAPSGGPTVDGGISALLLASSCILIQFQCNRLESHRPKRGRKMRTGREIKGAHPQTTGHWANLIAKLVNRCIHTTHTVPFGEQTAVSQTTFAADQTRFSHPTARIPSTSHAPSLGNLSTRINYSITPSLSLSLSILGAFFPFRLKLFQE